jgi:hypothetical protein
MQDVITGSPLNFGLDIQSCEILRFSPPESSCDVLLIPGFVFNLPWLQNSDADRLVMTPSNVTGKVSFPQPCLDLEGIEWLKLAEPAFKFWDNAIDEIWNTV